MRLIDADALPKYTGFALSADEVAMAVENAPTVDSIYGFHLRDLVAFAQLCRKYNLTPEVLAESLRDASWVVEKVYEDIRKTQERMVVQWNNAHTAYVGPITLQEWKNAHTAYGGPITLQEEKPDVDS